MVQGGRRFLYKWRNKATRQGSAAQEEKARAQPAPTELHTFSTPEPEGDVNTNDTVPVLWHNPINGLSLNKAWILYHDIQGLIGSTSLTSLAASSTSLPYLIVLQSYSPLWSTSWPFTCTLNSSERNFPASKVFPLPSSTELFIPAPFYVPYSFISSVNCFVYLLVTWLWHSNVSPWRQGLYLSCSLMLPLPAK